MANKHYIFKNGSEQAQEAICTMVGIDDIGELSDGHHTFDGLYHQRAVLFAALVKANKDKAWKSRKHNDGKYCFDDPNAATEQIAWEFKHLEEMDIFSMYFCASETSVGPICLYELGRYLCRMQMRFPKDWMERTVISIEDGYSRLRDVCMQLELAAPKLEVLYQASPERHAKRIMRSIRDVKYGLH